MSAPRKSFKTPAGTELPLLNLKGKEYLQVAHRLVWFREQNPDGIIKTTMLALQGEGKDEYAVFKSEIYVKGTMISSAHKKETRGGFEDFMEKAETGSIGRALALAGFGTQFSADELDEKDRLADAPLERVDKTTDTVTVTATSTNSAGSPAVPPKRTSFRKNVTVNGTGITTVASTGDDI